jgi:hypothetical protein
MPKGGAPPPSALNDDDDDDGADVDAELDDRVEPARKPWPLGEEGGEGEDGGVGTAPTGSRVMVAVMSVDPPRERCIVIGWPPGPGIINDGGRPGSPGKPGMDGGRPPCCVADAAAAAAAEAEA